MNDRRNDGVSPLQLRVILNASARIAVIVRVMSSATPGDFDPSQNASVKLMTHILEKGLQAGSVIGTGVVLPLTAYRARGSEAPLVPKLLKRVSKTVVVTTGVVGAFELRLVSCDACAS